MGSRYRCRVSPSGVPGCIPGLGTGATGESDPLLGGLNLLSEEGVPFSTEPLNFVEILSASWSPADLDGFTDLGNGILRYDGPDRLALLTARVSANATDANTSILLTYGLDGAPQDARVLSSATTDDPGSVAHVSISDVVFLPTGTLLSLFASQGGGTDFAVITGQLSVVAP